jgi:hypothetical protein
MTDELYALLATGAHDALHARTCALCGGPVAVGQRIAETPDARWAHVLCIAGCSPPLAVVRVAAPVTAPPARRDAGGLADDWPAELPAQQRERRSRKRRR